MGVRRGTCKGPLIAIAAHLDTVFPEDTDVKVKRKGTRLEAPGIGDDTRSLAVLLALIAAGMSPIEAGVAPVDSAELERYGADAQFLQYLEYRVALENSSHCQ
jgi:di/tripeptidase